MTQPHRRIVRPTTEFFDQLDAQLPQERTGRTPSRGDFQRYELLKIVDRFAADWDNLARLFPDDDEYRVLIVDGRIVHGVSVVGHLTRDGAVELVRLEIDLNPPLGGEDAWDEDDED